MFYGQPSAALFRVEHQHADGTWSILRPVEHEPHDSAEYDPERDWDRGHVYVCTSCEERVRVLGPRTEDPANAG